MLMLSSTNLFCFAVYTEDKGSTKKIYDLELRRTYLLLGSHIFGCKVFSDVWKKIEAQGLWKDMDWTVKAGDAVFLPSRLRQKQLTMVNRKYVNFGFFGNLEVISRKGLSSFDDRKTSLNYMGKEKETGNEPWGEDLHHQLTNLYWTQAARPVALEKWVLLSSWN